MGVRKNTTKRKTPEGSLFKALADAKRTPTTLLGSIQSYVLKKSSQDRSRRQDIVHPSETAKEDWCQRSTVYRISRVPTTDSKPTNGAQLEAIFQEGHDIHSKWQTWLAEMGRLWGKWKCTECDFRTGYQFPPDTCGLCGSSAMTYAEVPLSDEPNLRIAGHADGAVPDIEAFIEVKSIGLGTLRMEEPALVKKYTTKTLDGSTVVDMEALWNGIKRPLLSHRKQAGVYLYLARVTAERENWGWVPDKMVFIYESKMTQAVKEFVIKYDSELIDPLIERIKEVKDAVETGQNLPRPVGFTKSRKPCTSCQWRTHCWGEDSGEKSAEEQHTKNGGSESSSEARTGSSADPGAREASVRAARTAGRTHRTLRPRSNGVPD